MTLKQVIEALVFASERPLMPKEIVSALRSAAEETDDLEAKAFAKTKEPEVAALLEQLEIEYIESGRAFQLVEKISGWHLATEPATVRWVRRLYPESKPARLSGPALETLAIIAYRQPITRADIEAVRGVAVDGVMQSLLERGLVRIAGRAEVPGRPLLYETTQAFLEHFGLRATDELPNVEELRRTHLPTAQPPPLETAPEAAPATAEQPPAPEAEAEPAPEATPEPAQLELTEHEPATPATPESAPAAAAPETEATDEP